MGTLAKFVQDPNEVKRYTISWEDWLDVGETITAVVFEVTLINGDGSLMLVSSQLISDDNLSVSFLLSGGETNNTYKITMRVDTSSAQVKEDCVLVVVRNC